MQPARPYKEALVGKHLNSEKMRNKVGPRDQEEKQQSIWEAWQQK